MSDGEIQMKMIWAVVRWTYLKEIEKKLFEIGEKSFSITKVKGFERRGQSFMESDLVDHLKIEIFAQEDRVERIKEIIVNVTHTGLPGDGVFAIIPVEEFIKIRETKKA